VDPRADVVPGRPAEADDHDPPVTLLEPEPQVENEVLVDQPAHRRPVNGLVEPEAVAVGDPGRLADEERG
jgi:hypothetical protein